MSGDEDFGFFGVDFFCGVLVLVAFGWLNVDFGFPEIVTKKISYGGFVEYKTLSGQFLLVILILPELFSLTLLPPASSHSEKIELPSFTLASEIYGPRP